MKPVVFKDRVKLEVVAGNGGDGMASFRREKFVPRGGPDGGDGGRGGHVFFQASKDVDSLLPLYFRPQQRAGHGGRGGTQRRHGRNGQDLVIPVPCGTIACLYETDTPVGEVIADGDRLRVARGGKGGVGNCRFVTSTHQAPTEFTEGEEGEHKLLRVDLKMVADVGLVGYPNAGKSTLLRALTSAHPKTAPYPFTTLHPMVGTLVFDDHRRIRIVDVPGLIEGAHEGVGLGHDFLRHIERSRFLVFVLDMAGTDGRSPADDYRHLREELRFHKEELDSRPYLVVANKMDAPEAETNLEIFAEQLGEKPIPTIAELGEGTDELKSALHERVEAGEMGNGE